MYFNWPERVLFTVLIIVAPVLCVVPQANSQAQSQPATKDQAIIVLARLKDNYLVSKEILLGDQIAVAPGTFDLKFASGEKCGQLAARCVGVDIWLESLVLTRDAALKHASPDASALRLKIYSFYGQGQKGWHDGPSPPSYNRPGVLVQRSTRLDDGLVIQFSYSSPDQYPTLLFDVKINIWPKPDE